MTPDAGNNAIRIVVVDDHKLFTDALSTIFEGDDRFDMVGTASSGREAVKVVRDSNAEVVLMDMSMPVLDGMAATRRLMALDHAPKVIALSGRTDKLTETAALEAGATVFVSKSGAYDALVETILEVCGRS